MLVDLPVFMTGEVGVEIGSEEGMDEGTEVRRVGGIDRLLTVVCLCQSVCLSDRRPFVCLALPLYVYLLVPSLCGRAEFRAPVLY